MKTAHFLMSEVRCRPHRRNDDECRFRAPCGRLVDIDRAERQHEILRRALVELGAEVTLMPFVHGACDSVFIKDNALIVNEDGIVKALLARPRFADREREQEGREHAFAALGIEVIDDADSTLEGGDVALLPDGRGALLGYGFRSSVAAAAAVERFLEVDVTALELADERLHHLDMALSVLDDGTMLACREAFTEASWRTLVGMGDVVAVPRADALAFGLNLIELDGAVVLPRGADAVCGLLTALGREPITLPLDELQRGGGSVGCLVARVDEAPVSALLRRRRRRPLEVVVADEAP